MQQLIEELKTIGEPTRLRVMALLRHGELSVGELAQILGQSQPRLSRHMKFLTAANLVERLPEGAWVFYRLASTEREKGLIDAVLNFLPNDDETHKRDLEQLSQVRENREESANAYFERMADKWDDIRRLHYPEGDIEPALLDAAGLGPFRFMVDIGTGTGRMLSLFSDRYERAEGIDLSHHMLTAARSNLERDSITNAAVRHGDAIAPPFPDSSADLVIVHQVLHYLDRPEQVIREAARILRPQGRLLIVDFAPHTHEFLRSKHEHRHLGIMDQQVSDWASRSGLQLHKPIRFDPPETDGIAVQIWSADKLSIIGEQAA